MSDSILNSLKKVCKYHRSKEYYVANGREEFYLPGQNRDCWCLLTQGPVGPDDRFVSAGECNSSRPCFRSQIPD